MHVPNSMTGTGLQLLAITLTGKMTYRKDRTEKKDDPILHKPSTAKLLKGKRTVRSPRRLVPNVATAMEMALDVSKKDISQIHIVPCRCPFHEQIVRHKANHNAAKAKEEPYEFVLGVAAFFGFVAVWWLVLLLLLLVWQ